MVAAAGVDSRPPLLPSENNNIKSRVISSRRFPSPLISRSSNPSPDLAPKRSISADRRRASPHFVPDAQTSAATKLLVTSTRSLPVSFQGGTFSLPICKAKVTPPRKGTPERRRNITPLRGGGGDHVENSKPSDQHRRWPARDRAVTSTPLFKSSDHVVDNKSTEIFRPINGKPNLDLGNSVIVPSDSDSVSSDTTSGAQECSPNGPRLHVLAISGRWLQDTGSPLSKRPGSKLIVPPKLLASPRRMSSPIRGSTSPGKLMESPLRAHSPSRIRNVVSTICNSFLETPSVLSFAADIRRGKVGESQIFDAHLLRLLYNHHLQWRFVNGGTEDVLRVQEHGAEENLWNAWIAISDLRDTVTKKRHRLKLLRQKLKVASILRGQTRLLEDWAFMDKDHSVSLLGSIEALKASTLRLPIVGGAIANVQSLKDATGSALDVMHEMASSIYLLLSLVEEVNSLVTELAKVAAKERALLGQCTNYISLLTSMQVHNTSLRTHMIQYHHLDC